MQQQNCKCNHPSKEQLLKQINEVSFAVDDILLYLDTHPCDQDALAYYQQQAKIRNHALAEYAQHFGPLTVDSAVESENSRWEWVMQPWPWENKGGCE